ncbi:E3 ubiquitin ligase SCF complex subunit SKP1/ASK1 family protein [Artemisia annua]|uniref:SKP1-like protein n=1 Tax=Artemisia annua TaxID=35608 RepID=A0A2U1MV16_ARTAN|nr:E3 ubiquitin ligase SCF complex subunit SKP1/ASK1 family protein [Artemisia annua]
MTSSSSRTIILKNSDGHAFDIEETAAHLSLTIKQTIQQDPSKTIIPVPRVNAQTLSKIIDYCRKHVTDKDNKEALKSFDVEFVEEMNEVTLTYVSNAARVMGIESLHVLVSKVLGDRLRGKSVEEMCRIFSIDDRLKSIFEALLCYQDHLTEYLPQCLID